MRNDLVIADWRKYLGLLFLGSLWSFKNRGAGGSANYPGNFIPEIPRQLIPRFTKHDDIVADLFAGSETTADVCRELGRVYVGCDLRPASIRTECGDARTWDPGIPVQMIFLHPPYANIINYNERFGAKDGDLSLPPLEFLTQFVAVAANAFRLLEPGGYAILVIGDVWDKKRRCLIPLGFETMELMLNAGFLLKSITIKDFGNEVLNKGKNAHLWFYRMLKSDGNILEHEYVFTFKKPGK